jgi:diaminopimelate epimerase
LHNDCKYINKNMALFFCKYQGTGNDFILIDNRENIFIAEQERIAALCHRRFGIGADGLMLLQNCEGFDFEMIYFNADGKTSSMCGNGGRCIVAFAERLGIVKKGARNVRFLAIDGAHEAQLLEGDTVALAMQDVDIQNIRQIDKQIYMLDTGSPHYVQLGANLEQCDIMAEGRRIRYSPMFEEVGINVNFVENQAMENQANELSYIRMATYERGVEAPTFSCGTGATAAALVQHLHFGSSSPIYIATDGGNLSIKFSRNAHNFSDIWLIGAATFVFEGQIGV